MKHPLKPLFTLAALLAFIPANANAQTAPPLISAPTDIPYVFEAAPDDHILGSETAPNELIIYASVTCPHCSNWFTNEWTGVKQELVETGQLKIAFREFISQPAQIAVTGFTIANCAPEKDYFDVLEHQMEQQDAIFASLKAGEGVAAYNSTLAIAGIDNEQALTECLSDGSHKDRIQTSMDRARESGLRGVPAFILNGKLINGEVNADTLRAKLTK